MTLRSGNCGRMSRFSRTKGPWDRIHSVFQFPDHQGSSSNVRRGRTAEMLFRGKPLTAGQSAYLDAACVPEALRRQGAETIEGRC